MSRYESIQELEKVLEQRISDSHGSPFIAHCDVPLELEEAALRELETYVGGYFPKFLRLIPSFPCVCTRVVATALAESYGADGSQVYGLIANRLRVGDTIPQNHRHRFCRIFRHSCELIGLALPPVGGRLVDTYLFQAGISRSQLPALADTFLKAERLLGLPRSDDTRELDEWEDRAVALAPPGLTVLRRTVRDDPTAYHASTFMRLRVAGSSPTSRFERLFHEAIESPSKSSPRGRRAVDVGPSLEFADGELWVAIPQGAHRLEVGINGLVHPLSPGRRLALPLPWPATIEWRRPGAGDHDWQQFHVLADHQRILVFDGETGIYKGYLDCTVSSGQSVGAGHLCLLSQTAFTVNEEPCHRLGTDAFVLFCDISTEMLLQQRHLQWKVEVKARLRMDVFGERIVRNRDGWLLAGPLAARIHGRGADASEALEVCIRHPAINGDRRYSVQSNSGGYVGTGLDLPSVGDFGLARVSLHIRGQDRALYRTNFWYWPGLKQLLDERLFVATSIPENLAEEQLSHIGWDNRGRLALIAGEPYLRARLSFRVKRRLVSFTLPPPGASVSVRRPDGAERPLRVGASLSVRDDYASNLIVRYSDPTAAIDLKGEIIPMAFGKTRIWRVSFAALKQEGKHNRVRLLSDRELNSWLDLVRVVPEAEPTFFTAQQLDERWFVKARFERPIDAVRVEAENLITGERLDAEATLTLPSDFPDDSPLVTVFPATSSSHLRMGITQDNYGDGIWYVRLHILEHGRDVWFPIIDSSGHSYATCIAPNAYAQKIASASVLDWCPEAHRNQAFLRLSRIIETPIARRCRPNVVDLALTAWRRLGESLDIQDPSDRTGLLRASALPPAPHARETWMPVHHPIEVAPELFAAPAEDIGELASSEQPGYEQFESVGLAGITQSLQEAVEVLDVSTTFLIGFKGTSALQRDPSASPGDFNFSKYCGIARTIEQMADDDKPLSIWHHDRACERMADRVEIASRERFSSARLYKATTIVRHFTRHSSECLDIPHDLVGGFPLVEGAPRLMAALTRAWRNGEAEAFWDDLAFRVNWSVERVRKHVGTILRLAPELLAFYLLLWVLVERHERV